MSSLAQPSRTTAGTAGTAQPPTTSAGGRPSPTAARRLRRTAAGVTGVVACVLPVVWTVNFVRMLATGELAEHRFHQLTGQGLLLTTVWLLALVPLVAAGVRGRRPATAPALLHLAFVGVGAACAAVAPQGGAPVLMGIIAVTGSLVWLALPLRPRLRGRVDLAPASLAAALLLSAAVAPYAVDQLALQRVATGHHAQNPHYFDMAWLVLVLALVGLLGALLPAARLLQVVAGVGTALTGAAMLALGEGAVTGTLLAGTGALLVATWALTSRRPVDPTAPEAVDRTAAANSSDSPVA